MPPDGNEEQLARIAAAIADAAVHRFEASHSRVSDQSAAGATPVVLKWIAGCAAILLTAAIIGTANQIMSGVAEMQVTIARMDERQRLRDIEIDRRINDLEASRGEPR